jgi:uncharacterized protein (DUF58 family)
MQYGDGALNKYEYGCTIAACLAYLLLRQQDSVGCMAFDEGVRTKVPQRTKRSHLNSIITALDANQPREKTDLSAILRAAAEAYPRRGLMILVSDLLVERGGLLAGLRLLRQHGHDVCVFHVMDDEELEFNFSGPMRFEGLELDEHLACNPRALREGYLQALNDYLDEVRRGCASAGVDYTLVRTSDSLDGTLAAFLSHRRQTQRR